MAGQVKIYPGIDIDVPDSGGRTRGLRPTMSARSTRAAFDAGADGVVLSREYVEMWLANLSAAGDTLREIFSRQSPG